jgi:hypothetical protein
MEGSYYSAATSWIVFGGVVAGLSYYYWPEKKNPGDKYREDAQHAARRKGEARGRQLRRASPERNVETETMATERPAQSTNENVRKRKVQTKEHTQPAPALVMQADDPEDIDMSTKQWAQQMLKARKGEDLTTTKNKEQRVKTVKQSNAIDAPVLSSGSEDDASPIQSPDTRAGNVSDMLEPVVPGPSSMRITAPSKPQREKAARQAKEEVVETKKQRQNRQKVEERRMQQQADEQARKVLEENQRRTAREARGEPAKNGMQSAKAPAINAWNAKPLNGTPTPPAANVNNPAPLLDTFDVESNSSSNGGQASTAATSISGGRKSWDLDLPSEEDQLAQAMKQSEDESGWTTVAQPKKQKKKVADVPAEPVLSNKTNVPSAKLVTNSKPKGFQTLDVQYEQRADADPSDASNWDA